MFSFQSSSSSSNSWCTSNNFFVSSCKFCYFLLNLNTSCICQIWFINTANGCNMNCTWSLRKLTYFVEISPTWIETLTFLKGLIFLYVSQSSFHASFSSQRSLAPYQSAHVLSCMQPEFVIPMVSLMFIYVGVHQIKMCTHNLYQRHHFSIFFESTSMSPIRLVGPGTKLKITVAWEKKISSASSVSVYVMWRVIIL